MKREMLAPVDCAAVAGDVSPRHHASFCDSPHATLPSTTNLPLTIENGCCGGSAGCCTVMSWKSGAYASAATTARAADTGRCRLRSASSLSYSDSFDSTL